jgi:hypothetical protein
MSMFLSQEWIKAARLDIANIAYIPNHATLVIWDFYLMESQP